MERNERIGPYFLKRQNRPCLIETNSLWVGYEAGTKRERERLLLMNPYLKMHTKLETKSDRVKGLSFHSKRPWILASLHSGVIQLWDYRKGTLIDRFDEHVGPVRGVHFHYSQPLFVSGGDDYKIKVWNYTQRRCFTLLGHLDYIRTVQFHHEYPWIVSASDDQTIRIWNWQSRTCISVLTGHNHYVMCALFHPKEDLVVSASLDQTVRVWDIGAVKKKTVLSQMNTGFFGVTDAFVKYILKGHDRGVNWASFHPTLPQIVSGANGGWIKIWQMDDTKAWELSIFGRHRNNVSCVLFHARQEIIVTNSEDKCMLVWDFPRWKFLHSFERVRDRFWILAAHPDMNLLAAGHDSGMTVFKLVRERPAFSVSGDSLFYVKDRFLHVHEYSTQKEIRLMPYTYRWPHVNSLTPGPRTLSYSPTENAMLICFDMDGGSYELYMLPKESYVLGQRTPEGKRGSGGSAVFIARNRFAVLEKSTNQVLVKDLQNEIVKKTLLPTATDAIYYAGTGNLLCRAEDGVVIFDLQQRIVLGELQTPFIRYVVWSPDMESVALLGKYSIVLADKKLVHRCTLRETIRVKSGAWDDNGVFIYTTPIQIKYCLPNGDSGIIKTLDVPVYITKIFGKTIFCLDRDGKNIPIIIDSTEYIFKLALLRKDYDQVMSMIRNSKLCGQALIACLQQKGFTEVALRFVKDEHTRFDLTLESGNIAIALESAKKIDENNHWYRLGVEALRQGHAGIVEYVYQKTKNFERLSFHYLITGNLEKLSKMMKIAEVKNEVMGQFHDALYLGDIQERVKILENAGHLPLAYITAAVHGLKDTAVRLAEELGGNVPSLPKEKKASLLLPPIPILRGGDWPLLMVTKEGGLDATVRGGHEEYEEAADADWGELLDIGEVQALHNEDEGWDLEDLDLPTDSDTPKTASNARFYPFVIPAPGMPVSQIWIQKSSLAAEHVAAGNFDIALWLLTRQLGIRNFSPLKQLFADLHMGSHTHLCAFSSTPIISLAIERGWSEPASPHVRGPPALVFNFMQLEEKLKAAYRATTSGKFSDALRLFLSILHTIPLIVVESRREVDEVKELIIIVKEYILGLQMELKRKELKDNPVRLQELAAYFTHCNLQLPHLRLALQNAMSICFKAGNLSSAASFARRLLETNPTNESQAKQARQILQAAEKNMRDATQLNYDFRNPFVVCGATYVPIYKGQKDVACPYCATHFVPFQQGQLCTVCDLSVVGADASGLLCSPSQVK